jgi:signal transduction histidine kinase
MNRKHAGDFRNSSSALRARLKHSDDEFVSELEHADRRRLAVASQQGDEHERRRLSKELYDELGQGLSVLKLDLGWVEKNLAGANPRAPERIAQMQLLLDKILFRTRSIAASLRPPMLDDFGLVPALQWVTDNFQKRTGIVCHVELPELHIAAGDPAESAIFRVIQEGLLNIERHAHARHVHLHMRQLAQHVELLLQDDGVGMDAGSQRKPGCYGLIAMQKRVSILEGSISMDNTAGGGFAIHALIPTCAEQHGVSAP